MARHVRGISTLRPLGVDDRDTIDGPAVQLPVGTQSREAQRIDLSVDRFEKAAPMDRLVPARGACPRQASDHASCGRAWLSTRDTGPGAPDGRAARSPSSPALVTLPREVHVVEVGLAVASHMPGLPRSTDAADRAISSAVTEQSPQVHAYETWVVGAPGFIGAEMSR